MIKSSVLNVLFVVMAVQFNFNSIQAAVIDQVEKVEDCSICTVGLDQGETCECTNAHKFHLQCMKTWLQGKTRDYKRCPICRVHFDLPVPRPIAQVNLPTQQPQAVAVNQQQINAQPDRPIVQIQSNQEQDNSALINLIMQLSAEERDMILMQLTRNRNNRTHNVIDYNINLNNLIITKKLDISNHFYINRR